MKETEKKAAGRYRELKGFYRWLNIIFPAIGMGASIFYCFRLSILGTTFYGWGYLYMLIAFFLPLAFLLFPHSKGASRDKIPWHDILAGALAFAIPLYLLFNSYAICEGGWESPIAAPQVAQVLSLIFCLLILEAGRRTGGLPLVIICLFFGVFPLFTQNMPGLLEGIHYPFWRTICFHVMGNESITGIPMRVFGRLLVGFMVFAVALQITGGGRFFLNIALSLLGHVRGGAAKVAIVASGLFGSISGSVIANVLTAGAVTIPAMKRTGYPDYYAGAIEACAGTGGVLMPPIMGATAFVMAEFLGIPYVNIIAAAILPSLLYYLGLFIQADAYAARTGLKGLPKEECPSLKQTMKEGWFYIVAIILLIYLLVYARREAQAPFIAIALLLALSMIRGETRLTPKTFLQLFEGTGRILSELIAILCAIGFIIGSLSMTGVAHSFSSEIVALAGGNVALLLFLGAATSFVLGMGMTITACYIFLALVLAPALVSAGLYKLGVHLFLMYCGMISYITPPVALGAYAGASIAGASPIKTGFQAMRLGIVIYFLPFFFVLNPALVLHGPALNIVYTFFTCAIGIALIAGAIEGYLLGIGKISFLFRPLVAVSGILLGIPEWHTDAIGAVILATTLAIYFMWSRVLKHQEGSKL